MISVAKSLRVLVADDDQDTVRTLAMILRDEGYEVHTVYSGRSVMGAVLDYDPDAVILDINLPGLSGWEVAKTIRARRGNDRPLLIGISGEYKKGADQILAKILGFNDYLLKPFDTNNILTLLTALKTRAGGHVSDG